MGAVVLSAVLQTVIFPVAGPLPVWRAALAWLALVPWFAVLLCVPVDGWRGVRASALLSYLCGIVWYFGHCYWVFNTMHEYGGLSTLMGALVLFLFCCYLGLYHLLFGAVVAVVRWTVPARSGWTVAVLPVLWVAVELARARVTSFPWNLLGYAQVDNAVLTRMAPWAGVYALSFALALANAVLAWAWVRRDRTSGFAVAGTLLAVLVVGVSGALVRLPVPVADASAVLVQPNLSVGPERPRPGAEEPPLAQVLSGLSREADAGEPRAKVVLWPESPAPFYAEDPEFRSVLGGLASAVDAPVIAGAEGVGAGRLHAEVYNSAALFLPGTGFAGRYDKIHLVPFGEFMPYKELFSFASGLTEAVGRFDRGTRRAVLPARGHGYGVFLCYESIFGDEVRQFVLGGADVLVNLSDDGWYGDTSAPFQHINMARMRAMENRRWILRDTNTGITAVIDPYGTVRTAAARHVRTAVRMPFAYATELTFYTRYGDWFAYMCAAVTTALVLVGVTRRYGRAV